MSNDSATIFSSWMAWRVMFVCLLSSCTCLWTLLWRAVNWPKSPFVGTSVSSHWCWGCPEQPHQTTSSLAASPQMSLLSPRCVKSLEVRHHLWFWHIHSSIHCLCVSGLFFPQQTIIWFCYIWSLCFLPFSSQGGRTACGHRGCWTSVWSRWCKRFKAALSLTLRRQDQIHLSLGKVSVYMIHTEKTEGSHQHIFCFSWIHKMFGCLRGAHFIESLTHCLITFCTARAKTLKKQVKAEENLPVHHHRFTLKGEVSTFLDKYIAI